MSREAFWHIRSANYDKLYWTKDKSYLEQIVAASRLRKRDVVLDVGTGTGVIARTIQPHVRHVVGMDISESMLKKGTWEGFSLVKWDISDLLFANNSFDKVFARMVFHHILDNLDRVLLRCFDLLKDKGRLIVAEGVPPVDDPEVIDWYTHMFSYKEKRRTLTEAQLIGFLKHNGFKGVRSTVYTMKGFSIKNWLVNSGLDAKNQKKIMRLHREAGEKVKDAYHMKVTKDDCLVDTKNVIVVGEKRKSK